MKLRISPKEEQFLDYLKKTSEAQNSHEYRGSWQQIIRHIVDEKMIHDINKSDNPFKYVPVKKHTESTDSNSNSDSDTKD